MRVIQVASNCWLVIDNVFRPQFLIVYAPAVNTQSHETHILYRIDKWALERRNRLPQIWVDTYAEAVTYCRAALAIPDLATPIRDGYGSAISPEIQRQRWEHGMDPRSGNPPDND